MGLKELLEAAKVKARNSKAAKKRPNATLKNKPAQEIPTKNITPNYDTSGPMRLVEKNLMADLKDKGKGPGGLGRNERLKLERDYYKDKKLYLPKLNKNK